MKNILLKLISAVVLLSGIAILSAATVLFMFTAGILVAFCALVAPASKSGKYGFHVWIGYDKFCNAILGGSHKETISSRLGKSLYYGHGTVLGFKFIDRFIAFMLGQVDKDHCRKSIDWSVGSRHNAPV